MRAKLRPAFLRSDAYQCLHESNKRGGVVDTQNNPIPEQQGIEQQGFTTEDILWALGVWTVILSLSPVVVFYVLMVA
jgi:hypothetical protein